MFYFQHYFVPSQFVLHFRSKILQKDRVSQKDLHQFTSYPFLINSEKTFQIFTFLLVRFYYLYRYVGEYFHLCFCCIILQIKGKSIVLCWLFWFMYGIAVVVTTIGFRRITAFGILRLRSHMLFECIRYTQKVYLLYFQNKQQQLSVQTKSLYVNAICK